MNGRVHEEETPEGRLAAVAQSLRLQMRDRFRKTKSGPEEPDYVDYRAAFAPYVKREILLAKIDEARRAYGEILTKRMLELSAELHELNSRIPKEFKL
jgi:hypothetical protein